MNEIEQFNDQEGEKKKDERIEWIKFTVSDFTSLKMKRLRSVDMQIVMILILDLKYFFVHSQQ